MVKVYPAIIHKENGYWMDFPDLLDCFTNGDTTEELMKMAQEAMGLYLSSLIEDGTPLPDASDISAISTPEGCVTTYVSTDVDTYRHDTRAVKKILSIPAWLATEAESRNISLSKVLQDALKEQLNLT